MIDIIAQSLQNRTIRAFHLSINLWMICYRHQEICVEEFLHCKLKVAGEFRIFVRNDDFWKILEPINIVVIESGNLMSCDVLRGGDKVHYFGHNAIYDIKSVKLVASVVLRDWKVHKIHRNN